MKAGRLPQLVARMCFRPGGEVHIALTRGFVDDTIEILLGDSPIFAKAAVTTEPMLGLAASVEAVPLAMGDMMTVRVPSRALVSSFVLPRTKAPCYVGVSIEDGRLLCRFAAEPFGYL